MIYKSGVQVERSSILEYTSIMGSCNTNNRSRDSDCSLCAEMSSTSRSNCMFIFRNLSSIWMIYKSGVQVERSSIFEFTSIMGSCNTNNRSRDSDCSLCAEMSSTSRSNSLFIFRNFSSIGVIDKSGVQVERSSIFEVTGIKGNASTKNRSRSKNRDC